MLTILFITKHIIGLIKKLVFKKQKISTENNVYFIQKVIIISFFGLKKSFSSIVWSLNCLVSEKCTVFKPI